MKTLVRNLGGLAAILIVSAAAVVFAAEAEPVTLEKLLARVPVLDAKNDQLRSFHLKGDFVFPVPGKPIGGEIAWTREGGFGIVGMAGESRSPLFFLAEGWLFAYDVTSATAIIDEETWPDVSMAAEEEKIVLTVGYTDEKEKAGVHIDLPTFFQPTERKGTLTQVDAHTWRYVLKSPSGKSDMIADFQPAKPFPLTRIEINSDEKLGPYVLSEISVNEPVPTRLPKFPKLEQLPRELKLQAGDSIARSQQVDQIRTGFVFGRFAVDDPELRQHERFAHADWDKIQQTDAVILPQLRKLFLATEEAVP
jgi:hypothetical protein